MEPEKQARDLGEKISDLEKNIQRISEDRRKLMEANKLLSRLVLRMERKMNEYGIDPAEIDNPGNFSGELEDLNLSENFDESDIIQQITEVEHLIDEIEIYK